MSERKTIIPGGLYNEQDQRYVTDFDLTDAYNSATQVIAEILISKLGVHTSESGDLVTGEGITSNKDIGIVRGDGKGSLVLSVNTDASGNKTLGALTFTDENNVPHRLTFDDQGNLIAPNGDTLVTKSQLPDMSQYQAKGDYATNDNLNKEISLLQSKTFVIKDVQLTKNQSFTFPQELSSVPTLFFQPISGGSVPHSCAASNVTTTGFTFTVGGMSGTLGTTDPSAPNIYNILVTLL